MLATLLGGCATSKKIVENKVTNLPGPEINKGLNQLLADSGSFSKNIYNADKDITELELARGMKFQVPDDYELASDIGYSIDATSTRYRIKILRQKDRIDPEEYTDLTQRMPDKPLIVAFVDNSEVITDLFVIGSYSVLKGSMGWEDYDKTKIKSAVVLKDLDGDNLKEALVYTFKGYTADTEHGMVTFYYDQKNQKFAASDKIFKSTFKEAFDITEVAGKTYVVEANSGSGNCRVCKTPYMVRIYKYSGDYYFDIGSVGVEKGYEFGLDALNFALPKVKKKILVNDIFDI